MNKENLLKLADYLELNVTQEQFDMSWFRQSVDDTDVEFISVAECGTVGCALGYGPLVKGLEPLESEFTQSSYKGEDNHLDFLDYCKRVFNISGIDNEWDFLFSADWKPHDNTPLGAAARIKYLVSNPEAVKEFNSNDLEYYYSEIKDLMLAYGKFKKA